VLLSTCHINFSTPSTIDRAVTKYPNLCTLLQAPRNDLDAIARGQAETCSSYCYRKQFLCLENESGCNFQVAAIEQLPVYARCPIKPRSPSRRLNSLATKFASVRGPCGHHFFPFIIQPAKDSCTLYRSLQTIHQVTLLLLGTVKGKSQTRQTMYV